MVSREEMKLKAKQQLGAKLFGGIWLSAVLTYFVYTLIFGFAFGTVIGMIVVTGPLVYGVSYVFLKQARDGQKMNVGDIFKGFSDDFGQNFLIWFMSGLFTSLWSLLFVIPGIIKSFQYSMAYYVKIDHPEYKWNECINESKELMRGNCGRYFVLSLSFIGWNIVCSFTFGLGYWWLMPYMLATKAQFYEAIKAEKANNPYGNGGFAPQNGAYIPPQNGGFAPHNGGFAPQNGGFAPQNGAYIPPQNGAYIPQNNNGYGQQVNPAQVDPVGPTVAFEGNGLGIGIISCISGEWAGATFNLQNMEKVNIGRDSSACNIVLSSSATSAMHCSVQFNAYNGKYTVTDYSTNGTMLSVGGGNVFRLQKNVPFELEKGTIYIGDASFGIG